MEIQTRIEGLVPNQPYTFKVSVISAKGTEGKKFVEWFKTDAYGVLDLEKIKDDDRIKSKYPYFSSSITNCIRKGKSPILFEIVKQYGDADLYRLNKDIEKLKVDEFAYYNYNRVGLTDDGVVSKATNKDKSRGSGINYEIAMHVFELFTTTNMTKKDIGNKLGVHETTINNNLNFYVSNHPSKKDEYDKMCKLKRKKRQKVNKESAHIDKKQTQRSKKNVRVIDNQVSIDDIKNQVSTNTVKSNRNKKNIIFNILDKFEDIINLIREYYNIEED